MTYIGAAEASALGELARLPNCQVRVSLDGCRAPLHAKAWIFERDSGFGRAYVGSANLTQATLVWNGPLSFPNEVIISEPAEKLVKGPDHYLSHIESKFHSKHCILIEVLRDPIFGQVLSGAHALGSPTHLFATSKVCTATLWATSKNLPRILDGSGQVLIST